MPFKKVQIFSFERQDSVYLHFFDKLIVITCVFFKLTCDMQQKLS